MSTLTENRIILDVDDRPFAMIVLLFLVLLIASAIMVVGCVAESLCQTLAGGFLLLTTTKLLKG